MDNGDKTFIFLSEFSLPDCFTSGVVAGDFDNNGFADLLVVTAKSQGERVDIEVEWPSGVVERFAGQVARQTVELVEGTGVPR